MRQRLIYCGILIVGFLLSMSVHARAQTVVNLGKPTPSAQNQITVNVQTALGALPASPAACTVAPLPGTGPYQVVFTASTDHNVIEHQTAKVTGYELVVIAPSTQQPCYTVVVRAVGPGGQEASAVSAPFVLAPGRPAPAGIPGITRSSGQ